MGCDPCGTCFHRLDFWNDCEKCGGETIGEKLENLRGTISEGISASVSTGIWAFGVQYVRSMDLKGNVEYQWTFYGGISTGTPSVDISAIKTVTNAPDVKSLRGTGYSVGAAGALGGAAGVDMVIIPPYNSGENAYLGGSISAGLGAGADIHVMWGETYSIRGFNLFDVFERALTGA